MQHCSSDDHCGSSSSRIDWLLWGSLALIILAFVVHFALPGDQLPQWLVGASHTSVDLMKKMAWGLIFAILFVGLLDLVPREKFHQVLGRGDGMNGILRATLAGVLLDLCSHGILLVGMKLYERGASLGQVVAFLVASPWNSFSMTVILVSLIGLKLTLLFILASCLVAIVSGWIILQLVAHGVLEKNPNDSQTGSNQNVPWIEWPKDQSIGQTLVQLLRTSLHESKMILRWIFFGVLLTAAVKELFSPENFEQFFGADFYGVLLTLGAATVLEVCSEGSAPLASELVTTANAPGNGFTFLMAGVSTDYTEIMAIKETTKSWKMALFLPLVTLPQIIILGIIINRVFAQ